MDVIIIVALIIISFIHEGVMFITNINKDIDCMQRYTQRGKLYNRLPLKKDSDKINVTNKLFDDKG